MTEVEAGTRGGFPTAWVHLGQGPRDALMIHCSLADSGIWAGVAQGLEGRARAVAFDLPGHGKSGDWDARGDMGEVCAAMAADFADDTAPVDVVGHSFGAVVALALAARHPGLVRTLVMIEPVFFAAGLQGDPAACADHLATQADFRDALDAEDLERAARIFLGEWGGGRPWDSFGARSRTRMAAQMPLIAAAGPTLYGDALNLLDAGALEAVATPSLLLRGSEAPRIVPAINAELARRLPDARQGVIEGAGHMSVATHARDVSAAITAFWERS